MKAGGEYPIYQPAAFKTTVSIYINRLLYSNIS